MKFTKTELEAFRIIAKKMPIADCDKCKAEVIKSWSVVSHYLTASERERLWLAAANVIHRRDPRGDFDSLIRAIYQRLGID